MTPHLLLLLLLTIAVNALSLPPKAIVVTGANKGQGFALCQRILEEHDDTYVFLCARDEIKGQKAVQELGCSDRVEAVTLDVTDVVSVRAAAKHIQQTLGEHKQKLYGCVSNAGILWGHSLQEQFETNARGVRRVLNAFLPLMNKGGRMIVVSSGLGPLMHSYASEENKAIMNQDDLDWDKDLEPLLKKCLQADDDLEQVGFPGGPFAEAAPDFHLYGLAKMFAEVYMASLGKKHATSSIQINSCDPGLVYTDLILKMPRYDGQSIEETNGAQTPKQGVEAAMRLLFDDDSAVEGSGHFYAMNKAKDALMKSTIDVKPAEE